MNYICIEQNLNQLEKWVNRGKQAASGKTRTGRWLTGERVTDPDHAMHPVCDDQAFFIFKSILLIPT